MKPPPEPGTLPIITCPACGHGIDSHRLNYYAQNLASPPVAIVGKCEAAPTLTAEGYMRCDCQQSPNDIAARGVADEREQIALGIEALLSVAATEAAAEQMLGTVILIRSGALQELGRQR